MSTFLLGLVTLQAIALPTILGLCQAARHGDQQLAECARQDGHPEIAEIYLQGAPA